MNKKTQTFTLQIIYMVVLLTVFVVSALRADPLLGAVVTWILYMVTGGLRDSIFNNG